jgi:hypothetical protein
VHRRDRISRRAGRVQGTHCLAWFALVLPALLLNYAGQAASFVGGLSADGIQCTGERLLLEHELAVAIFEAPQPRQE